MESKRTCPECHLSFEAPLPESGILACPLCNTMFSALPPAAPPPAAPVPAASGRQVLRGVLAVGALLFLAGGLVCAYHLWGGLGQRSAALPMPAPAEPPSRPSQPPPVIEIVPVAPSPPPPLALVERPRPSSRPPELKRIDLPEQASKPLTLEERVNRAIDRGVAHLRAHHGNHTQYRRHLGLLGLTLLEYGISDSDPSVQQIAACIRGQQRDLTQTYELTLAILFLDHLGVSGDRPLIRAFGQRLVAGQLECGAWTYSCLMSQKRNTSQTWAAKLPYWNGAPGGKRAGQLRRPHYRGDNSNTQFAILGLWVAQRHGVPARAALLATEQYFRATQASDGSWGYHPSGHNWRDSMTCAGLMSLAMRFGVISGQGRDIRPAHPIHVSDAAVHRGLRYLAQSLDKVTLTGNRIVGAEARDPLYFLWSLERMAVIYDLQRVGDREWYPWAAEMLVAAQHPDGRWQGMSDPIATCFALLILKRSNFAKDLQLAVQPPASPLPALSNGPTILQGPSSLRGTVISPSPSSALGPSITRTRQSK